jgi:hypothetical protein
MFLMATAMAARFWYEKLQGDLPINGSSARAGSARTNGKPSRRAETRRTARMMNLLV